MLIKLKDREIALPSDQKAQRRFVSDLFVNDGQTDDGVVSWGSVYESHLKGKPYSVTDAQASDDFHPILMSSMEEQLRMPMEPRMVITGLFNKVQARGLKTEILAGAIGSAVQAQDIPEHGTYPESSLQIGGGLQVAYIGKSGIACSFTDEALRYTNWDIMRLNLEFMGRALVRHKEQKAVSFLRRLGTELFNNASPTTSLFGVLTGRGLDMAGNGSLTVDDLLKGLAFGAEQGYPYDTMLINPQFYFLFVQDAVLRGMMMATGAGSYFQQWSGTTGPVAPWANLGGKGPANGQAIVPGSATSGATATGIAGREYGMTSVPPLPPGYFPWQFNIIVSPFVPFDAANGLGDIYLLNSGNVGMYLEDESATISEWRDESVDHVKVKIRERYGFAISNDGLGIGVIKNAKLARNYWDGTVSATTTAVSAEISPTASVI